MTPFRHASNLAEAMTHMKNGMGVALKQGSVVTELAIYLYEDNTKNSWNEADDFERNLWLKEAREVMRLYLDSPQIH